MKRLIPAPTAKKRPRQPTCEIGGDPVPKKEDDSKYKKGFPRSVGDPTGLDVAVGRPDEDGNGEQTKKVGDRSGHESRGAVGG